MGKQYRGKLTAPIVLSLSMFSNLSFAETKLLVCENSLGENYLELSLIRYEEECRKNDQYSCERIAGIKADMEICKASGVHWSHHKEFLFDAEVLKLGSGYAEYFTETCWGAASEVERILIKSTPSIITFIKPESNPFNVERKTLRAGFKLLRDYQCQIKKPNTSRNKI